jgi:predicted amidohydrolase YtcJ
VHAIGDAGNHQILDTYQKLLKKSRTAALRHRIEHAQVVTWPTSRASRARHHPVDAADPRDLGQEHGRAARRPERIKGAYAWRTFLQAGFAHRLRFGLPGRVAESLLRHPRRRHAPGHGQPIAGWYPNRR